MKDILGKALLDFQNGVATQNIITSTNISYDDELPLAYLFRDFNSMPKLEQIALNTVYGTTLDVGCGAGSHSLYLQAQGKNVKAIDVSKGAIAVAKARGVRLAEVKALLNETETFDTILLLMNGTGIFNSIAKTPTYLKHLKKILRPNGQILIDSSDIKYMYEDDEGEFQIPKTKKYYGELSYYLSYNGESEVPLKWLYLDFETLKTHCENLGLTCTCIAQGEHYDYLACIKN